MRFELCGFLSVLISLLAIPANTAHSAPRYILMASIGDSITAGTLAHFDLPRLNPWTVPQEEGVDPRSEIEAQSILDNKYTLSWAAGDEIFSHFRLLAFYMGIREGEKLRVLNAGELGAETKDMVAQAQRIADAMKSGKYIKLNYVTVFLGSNDTCSGNRPDGLPNERIIENLLRGFQKLAEIQQEEPIRVLVSGLPRIPDLGKKEIRETMSIGNYTCEQMHRGLIGGCKNMIGWETDEEYQAAMTVVAEKNDAIRSASLLAEQQFPNLDIHFANPLSRTPIKPDQLSVDCFHPNSRGQQEIAFQLWNKQPWFR